MHLIRPVITVDRTSPVFTTKRTRIVFAIIPQAVALLDVAASAVHRCRAPPDQRTEFPDGREMPTSASQAQVGTVLVRCRPNHLAGRRILPRKPGTRIRPADGGDAFTVFAFLARTASPATSPTPIVPTLCALARVSAIRRASALVLPTVAQTVPATRIAVLVARAARLTVIAQAVAAAVPAVAGAPGAVLSRITVQVPAPRHVPTRTIGTLVVRVALPATPPATIVTALLVVACGEKAEAAHAHLATDRTAAVGFAGGAVLEAGGAKPIPADDLALPCLTTLSFRTLYFLVRIPTTVIIDAVACFGSQVRYGSIQWLAVSGIEVPVVVVVEITKIAHSIEIKVLLFRIVQSRTVVLLVFHSVVVLVGYAVCRAVVCLLIEVCLALPVPAAFPAVRRAGLSCLRKSACPIAARSAVHRTFFRHLVAVADSVAARRVTILGAVLFGFTTAANPVAASCTI